MEKSPPRKINDHLANERTFLAWVRTSIGIMGFGFVVVKFSLFVKQIALMLGTETPDQQKGYSGVIGIVLVAMGALISLLSLINYRKVRRQIDTDSYRTQGSFITIITVCIIVISALLTWYLIGNINRS